MRRTSGLNVLEVVIVVGIVAILFVVLMPAITPRHPASQASHCQSNFNQIGKALKMYLSDWDDTFPVNGSRTMVRLSDPSKTDEHGYMIRFQHGINWVEALKPYVEKVSEGDADWAWACPVVYTPPRFGKRAWCVTYAFNANLTGKSESVAKVTGSLMTVRELGKPDHAVLRPKAPSTSAKTPPDDPFLDADETTPGSKYKLHGDGSHVLFADGHVKSFGMAYFPESCEWDRVDKQWYNYATLPENDPRNKSIAVSP